MTDNKKTAEVGYYRPVIAADWIFWLLSGVFSRQLQIIEVKGGNSVGKMNPKLHDSDMEVRYKVEESYTTL